ncbi:hypothetical protein XENTR_v10024269 [Xenopus tropicalis]|nr:hypothetical protein XENTR_v10024269 [Xenopus tropicalis]
MQLKLAPKPGIKKYCKYRYGIPYPETHYPESSCTCFKATESNIQGLLVSNMLPSHWLGTTAVNQPPPSPW